MSDDPWERLSLFESQDLLSSLYRAKHRRTLSPKKASEVTACLVQGRQFFAAASTAEDLVRPLLLYYGVLVLTRGLILFMDPAMRLTSLSPAHGIETRDWSRSLLSFGGGARFIPELEVSLTGSGTFAQLTSVSKNNERWRVFGVDYPFEFRGLTSGQTQINPMALTVRNILERVADLKTLFEKTFHSSSQCHPSFVFVHGVAASTYVEAIETDAGLLDGDQLSSLLSLEAGATTRVQAISERGASFVRGQQIYPENVTVRGIEISHGSVDDLLLHLSRVKNDRFGNIYLVAPLPDGTVLSSMSLLFLLSYVMGMLVRYYPSVWQSLVARESGDFTFPLLRAAMGLVHDQFPLLLVNELEDVPPKFPGVNWGRP